MTQISIVMLVYPWCAGKPPEIVPPVNICKDALIGSPSFDEDVLAQYPRKEGEKLVAHFELGAIATMLIL